MKWRKFSRLLCKHQFVCIGSEIVGATLGWVMLLPTRQYEFHYKCDKCGLTKSIGGQVVYGDRKLHPEAYNERGWPVDKKGKELPIAPAN